MEELIAKLEEDHRRIAHVVLKLVSELEACHNAAFYNPHFVKHFTDELSYVYEYPAYLNHPLENRIFEKLLEKNIPDQAQIRQAIEQHGVLEQRSGALLQRLHGLIRDKKTPPADLLNQAQELLNLQLEHQKLEAHSVFPLFRQYLKTSEVTDIQYKMMELPRYATMRQHFGSLYNNIVNRRAAG